MRFLIASVGRFRPGPERDLFHHYVKRLPWKLELKELEVRGSPALERRKAEESKLLLEAAKGYTQRIALDAQGKMLSSRDMAGKINTWRVQSDSSVAFLIGGADGLTPAVLADAHQVWSLGHMTWPHLLVRGMLAEQLYRAYTLTAGHPYHRE